MNCNRRHLKMEDRASNDARDVIERRRKKFGGGSTGKPMWPASMSKEMSPVKRSRPEPSSRVRDEAGINHYKEFEQRKRSAAFRQALRKTFGMNTEENFVERKEPDYLDPLIDIYKDTIHLYGVDFMDTGSIILYFSHFQPKEIVWVNASSANVSFDDESTAKKAFFANLRHQPPTKHEKYIKGQANPSFDPFEPRDKFVESEWMEMLPTYSFGVQRKMFARFATSEDKTENSPEEDIRSEKAMMLVRCMNLIHCPDNPSKRHHYEPRTGHSSRDYGSRSRSTSKDSRGRSSRDRSWSRSSTASNEEAFLKYIEEGRKRQHLK